MHWRQVSIAMNNTHPRTQASSWSIENSPFRVRAVLRLMFHLWRKTPCLCGGVFSALTQTHLPHENPQRINACRIVYGCLRVFFLHFTSLFICIPSRVSSHCFLWAHPSFPVCLGALYMLSGQLGVVGEDTILNMVNWLISYYSDPFQFSHWHHTGRSIRLEKPRL